MTDAETPANPDPAPTSPAQSLYDRMMATRDRYVDLAKRFNEVKNSISPQRVTPAPQMFGQAIKPSTFFEGMDLILLDLDRTGEELGRGIEDLARLF